MVNLNYKDHFIERKILTIPPELIWVEEYLEKVKEYIWIRVEDQTLILRPVYVHHLNELGTFLLHKLLPSEGKKASLLEVINILLTKYPTITEEQIIKDIKIFFKDLRSLVDKKGNPGVITLDSVEMIPFRSRPRFYPILSEIALTYKCNNSCLFCYAHSPYIGAGQSECSTEDFKRLLSIIRKDAKVPSVSFTGGEPTVRPDLPELIAFARSLDLRVNLITNGRTCAKDAFVQSLKKAGLQSAQISLEAANPAIHDELVQVAGAFQETVQGIRNLKNAGIHVHTNTTINQLNKDALEELIKFLAHNLKNEYFSMNALILTGSSLSQENRQKLDLKYSDLEPIIQRIDQIAKTLHIQFIWYSPTCYHYLNPTKLNLGIKQCAACDGLLSLNPQGEILPCSSFQTPIGPSLLNSHVHFEDVWGNPAATYWRQKKYVRPECDQCKFEYLCKGACPLYWDAQGCSELTKIGQKTNFFAEKKWNKIRKKVAPQYGTLFHTIDTHLKK